MTIRIQKPTIGHTVIYTNKDSEERVAFVKHFDANTGYVTLYHVDWHDDGSCMALHLASCKHDAGDLFVSPAAKPPKPNTWRYPPRCDDTIEVER